MEKINVAELLKDCPKGMELNCYLFNGLEFDHIDTDSKEYPIVCRAKSSKGNYYNLHTFTEYGWYSASFDYSKCVIFPKGKTTWEGFQRPFKDGDIVCTSMDSIAILGDRIGEHSEGFHSYCGLFNYEFDTNVIVSPERLATEEEKAELFRAIKDNGYKWNEETKTLEKLPKFKVGDKVRFKNDKTVITITVIKDDYYLIQYYNTSKGDYQNEKVSFKDQDKYELVPSKFDINTLIPFESRVLARNNVNEKWYPGIWGFYDDSYNSYPYNLIGDIAHYCIPYEGNEYLLGTTDDCDEYFKTWK